MDILNKIFGSKREQANEEAVEKEVVQKEVTIKKDSKKKEENPMSSAYWEKNPSGRKVSEEETEEKEPKLKSPEFLFIRKTKSETQENTSEEVKVVFSKGENSGDVGGKMIVEGKEEEIIEIRTTAKTRVYITESGTYEISKEKYVNTRLSFEESVNNRNEKELTKSKGYLAKTLEKISKDKRIPLLLAAGLVGIVIALPVAGTAVGAWYGMGLAQAVLGPSHGILFGAAADFSGAASVVGGVGGIYVLKKLIDDARNLVKKPDVPDTPDAPDEPKKPKPEPGSGNTTEVIITSERIIEIRKRREEILKILTGAENIKKTKETYEKSLKKLEEGAQKIEEGINELGDDQKEAKESMKASLVLVREKIEETKKQIESFETYLDSDSVKNLEKELKALEEEEKNLNSKQQKKEDKEENESEEMFGRYDGTGSDYEEEEVESKKEENESEEMFGRYDGTGSDYEEEEETEPKKEETEPKKQEVVPKEIKERDKPTEEEIAAKQKKGKAPKKPIEKPEPIKPDAKEELKDAGSIDELLEKEFKLNTTFAAVKRCDEALRNQKGKPEKNIKGFISEFYTKTGFQWTPKFNFDQYLLEEVREEFFYKFQDRIKNGGDKNVGELKNFKNLKQEEKDRYLNEFKIEINKKTTPQQIIDAFNEFNGRVMNKK